MRTKMEEDGKRQNEVTKTWQKNKHYITNEGDNEEVDWGEKKTGGLRDGKALDQCSKFTAKRKVYSENRQFKEEWKKCAFILPPTSTRPMCLTCQETMAVMKISSLKRHYETKHRNFEETFPQNSEVRTTKINALKSPCQAASRILVTSKTQQQKATECLLTVVWILG